MNESPLISRRRFLMRSTMGLGAVALSQLLGGHASGAISQNNGVGPHFRPRARRVIFLFQAGGPSQLETLDYKPQLKAHYDKDLPDSVRMGQRITGMVTGQSRLPIAPSKYSFKQCGQSGLWISD